MYVGTRVIIKFYDIVIKMSYTEVIRQGIVADSPVMGVKPERYLGSVPVGGLFGGREVAVAVSPLQIDSWYPLGDEDSSPERIAGGVLHGLEIPSDPSDPAIMHFVEAPLLSHKILADALSLPRADKGAPTRLGPTESAIVNIGALFHIDIGSEIGIMTFFRRVEGPPDLDQETAYGVTTALARVLGPELYSRIPGNADTDEPLTVYCNFEDQETVVEAVEKETIPAFRME